MFNRMISIMIIGFAVLCFVDNAFSADKVPQTKEERISELTKKIQTSVKTIQQNQEAIKKNEVFIYKLQGAIAELKKQIIEEKSAKEEKVNEKTDIDIVESDPIPDPA